MTFVPQLHQLVYLAMHIIAHRLHRWIWLMFSLLAVCTALSSTMEASWYGWSFQVNSSYISQCSMTWVCDVFNNRPSFQVLESTQGNDNSLWYWRVGLWDCTDQQLQQIEPFQGLGALFVSLWCVGGALLFYCRATASNLFLYTCMLVF